MDLPDGGARMLHLRDGHSSPPTKIEFFAKNGESIVSAGRVSEKIVFSHNNCNRTYNVRHH